MKKYYVFVFLMLMLNALPINPTAGDGFHKIGQGVKEVVQGAWDWTTGLFKRKDKKPVKSKSVPVVKK